MITFKFGIKSLRIKRGLTQLGLAKLSGNSKTLIGDIETGVKTTLTKKQADGFCRAFKCDPGNLQEKKINLEKFKNNPKVILLMETFKKYEIDINNLSKDQEDELLACLFIAIR